MKGRRSITAQERTGMAGYYIGFPINDYLHSHTALVTEYSVSDTSQEACNESGSLELCSNDVNLQPPAVVRPT